MDGAGYLRGTEEDILFRLMKFCWPRLRPCALLLSSFPCWLFLFLGRFHSIGILNSRFFHFRRLNLRGSTLLTDVVTAVSYFYLRMDGSEPCNGIDLSGWHWFREQFCIWSFFAERFLQRPSRWLGHILNTQHRNTYFKGLRKWLLRVDSVTAKRNGTADWALLYIY